MWAFHVETKRRDLPDGLPWFALKNGGVLRRLRPRSTEAPVVCCWYSTMFYDLFVLCMSVVPCGSETLCVSRVRNAREVHALA